VRRGGASRLAGLRVYYDFNWTSVFGHDRATFPGGKSLAHLVLRECPKGKTAALLLTVEEEPSSLTMETPDEYVAILPIHDYLNNAGADPASTYYARRSRMPLTQIGSLAEVTFSGSELDRFLDEHLTTELIARWIGRSSARNSVVSDLGSSVQPSAEYLVRALVGDDPELRDQLAQRLSDLDGGVPLRTLFVALTEGNVGRAIATSVMGGRLADRIADTRQRLEEYEALIHTAGASETDVQRFLEENPWIVGLPYVSSRARVEIPRGILDFVLDRFDGFFDVIELKGPQDPIIVEPQTIGQNRPPSASEYSLGPALAKALAQSHHYRALLDQTHGLENQYGLLDTRQPKILILLGRSDSLSETSKEILRQLNLSLHRVEVIPYDALGHRTAGLLNNVEAMWNRPDSEGVASGSAMDG
jgi:hypothetical protein